MSYLGELQTKELLRVAFTRYTPLSFAAFAMNQGSVFSIRVFRFRRRNDMMMPQDPLPLILWLQASKTSRRKKSMKKLTTGVLILHA